MSEIETEFDNLAFELITYHADLFTENHFEYAQRKVREFIAKHKLENYPVTPGQWHMVGGEEWLNPLPHDPACPHPPEWEKK